LFRQKKEKGSGTENELKKACLILTGRYATEINKINQVNPKGKAVMSIGQRLLTAQRTQTLSQMEPPYKITKIQATDLI